MGMDEYEQEQLAYLLADCAHTLNEIGAFLDSIRDEVPGTYNCYDGDILRKRIRETVERITCAGY
jgi:hypothetical protein